MLLGLRTVVYKTPDLAVGRAWYAELLGVAPYFDEPFYVGFDVGGFELGLDPDVTTQGPGRAARRPTGASPTSRRRSRARPRGAAVIAEPLQEVGGGIKVARSATRSATAWG
jgi:catechol 2,3-dioxygenase-like lactoylglutathione lyase family enzyme